MTGEGSWTVRQLKDHLRSAYQARPDAVPQWRRMAPRPSPAWRVPPGAVAERASPVQLENQRAPPPSPCTKRTRLVLPPY